MHEVVSFNIYGESCALVPSRGVLDCPSGQMTWPGRRSSRGIRRRVPRLWPGRRLHLPETTMSALSVTRQKHPSSEHVPVSVITVNSSPPPLQLPTAKSSADSREIFDLGTPGPPDANPSSADRQRNAATTTRSNWAGWRDRPPSGDVWTATCDDDGGPMRRSTSATLSNEAADCHAPSSRPQSPHYGSAHHLGSSVTFCNAAAGGNRVNASVDNDEEIGNRRSLSFSRTTDADVVLRPSGTTTGPATQLQQQQQQQSKGKLGLTLPVITCDGVASVPTSPLRRVRGDVTGFGSTQQLQPCTMSLGGGSRAGGSSRTILVTPHGSFLSVNQSPIEFRESTFSVSNYSNGVGTIQ